MSNQNGTAYALTTYARVETGHEDALDAYLTALPTGADSPFARLDGVHLARVQVFRKLVHQGPHQRPDPLRHAHLVVSTTFNGGLDEHLRALAEHVPECDGWWGHCVRYPGREDSAAFPAYVRSIQRRTSLFSTPFPTATVDDVRTSIALRAQVIEFAASTQHLDADELHRRFLEAF